MAFVGKIIKMEGNVVTVEILSTIKCNECKSCCNFFKHTYENRIINFNKSKLLNSLTLNTHNIEKAQINLNVGDIIEVDIRPFYAIIFAFIIFGLPVTGFCIGIIYAYYLSNWQIPNDIVVLKYGLIGLLYSLVLIFLIKYLKTFENLEYKIRIIKKNHN